MLNTIITQAAWSLRNKPKITPMLSKYYMTTLLPLKARSLLGLALRSKLIS